MNNVKTFVLMGALVACSGWSASCSAAHEGLVLALVFGSLFNFIMYFFSDRLVLRMYGAHVVTEAEAPELYRDGGPAAPAGRAADAGGGGGAARAAQRVRHRPKPEQAVVAVTTGILKYMPQEELEGVIAHELAHIKNRDMLIATVAAGIAGALSNLPYLLLFGGGRATTRAGIRSPSSRCCCWRRSGPC